MDIYPTTLAFVDGGGVSSSTTGSDHGGTQQQQQQQQQQQPSVVIDGESLLPLLAAPLDPSASAAALGSEAAATPAEAPRANAPRSPPATPRVLFHYCGSLVHAVRRGRFKLHLKTALYTSPEDFPGNRQSCSDHAVCGCEGEAVEHHDPPLLFNLYEDAGETAPLDPASAIYAHEAGAILSALEVHSGSFVAPPSQLERFAPPWLFPCCDGFFKCECDRDPEE